LDGNKFFQGIWGNVLRIEWSNPHPTTIEEGGGNSRSGVPHKKDGWHIHSGLTKVFRKGLRFRLQTETQSNLTEAADDEANEGEDMRRVLAT
jgi:hypothetical protein